MSDLKIERSLSAPPTRVWQALTDPAKLREWFWPPSFGTTAEIDLQSGGQYRVSAPGGPIDDFGVSGHFADVVPPHSLKYSWQWNGEEGITSVEVTLAARGSQTLLTLVHAGFDSDENRDQHIQGWTDCLDRLDGWL